MSGAAQRPSRRSVLTAAGVGLLALTGCVAGDESTLPPVDPEVRTRARIADEVRALSRRYKAVVAAFPDADAQLLTYAAEHDAHARALSGTPVAASRGTSSTASPSPSAEPTVPPALPAAIRSLVSAEQAAVRRRSRQAGRASPALARLLASIAGCEAAHALLLQGGDGRASVGPAPVDTAPVAPAPVGPRATSRDAVVALQEVLAAEHAVIYGYGVAGARMTGGPRRRTQQAWNRHRARRDELAGLLTGLGGDPDPTAATYDLPAPVESAGDARELAILLEERLAAVWADAVTGLDGELRDVAVRGLGEAAVAAAAWRGGSVAFPGLPERAAR